MVKEILMSLIIFDCDGVLRSVSWEAMYAAYLAISDHISRDPADFWSDVHDFRKWHNNDWHFNLERMGVPRGTDYSVISKMFHEIYDPSIYKFHWVEEVLETLSKKHTLAVLSAAKSDSVKGSLDVSVRHFSCIKGVEHVKNIKPHPEGINQIMYEMNFDMHKTVMIGDSHADIEAGKNAGVMTIGVTWGMTEAEDMESLRPDLLCHDPLQLKSL